MLARPWLRAVVVVLGCAALWLATVKAQDAALAQRKHFPAEEDALYLPRPSALRAMSLGHHELTADLVFLRAIIYFGAQFHADRKYTWLDNYLDTIVALDPEWKTPYRWAGVATMYNGRAITNDEVLASNHFLSLGVKQFPDDWNLAFMLGFNYLFELKTTDAALEAKWKAIGAEYVRHAALVGGAPSWVPLLAATIMEQEGQKEAAVRHLEQVYLTAQDEAVRQQVKNRLVSLHAKLDFARIQSERDKFTREWRATAPYASPDFFAVLGAAPSPRLDLAALAPDPIERAEPAEPASILR